MCIKLQAELSMEHAPSRQGHHVKHKPRLSIEHRSHVIEVSRPRAVCVSVRIQWLSKGHCHNRYLGILYNLCY